MATVFDVVTVAGFVAMVLAFFQFTDRGTRTLLSFLFAAVVLGIANQVGNAGATLLASLLILSGLSFAFFAVKR